MSLISVLYAYPAFQQIVAGTAGQIRRFVPARPYRIDCDHFPVLPNFPHWKHSVPESTAAPFALILSSVSALITIDIIKGIFAVQLAQSFYSFNIRTDIVMAG